MESQFSAARLSRAISRSLVMSAFFFAPAAFAGGGDAWDGSWHSSFTIYGWIPGIDAQLAVPVDTGTAVSKSNGDILNNLSGALMLSGDIRNGDWGFYGDVDWVNFSNEKGRFRSIGGENIGGTATLNTSWDFKGGLATLAGIYSLMHGPSGYTDLVFGGRYLWVKTNLDWDFSLNGNGGGVNIANSGHVASNTHSSNAIIGLRGRWQSGNTGWYVPYYLDVGAGDSDVTSIIDAGVGYAFDWADLAFDWRWVHYDQGNDSMVQKFDLSGPSISLTWHF